MTPMVPRLALVPVLALFAAGCGRGYEGGGDLRARKVVLEREVDGPARGRGAAGAGRAAASGGGHRGRDRRHPAARPDRGAAALRDRRRPVPPEPARSRGAASGAPRVRLRGALASRSRLDLEAVVDVIGALDDIAVDAATRHAGGEDRGRPHRDREGRGDRGAHERLDAGRDRPHDPAPARGQAPADPDPGEGPAEHRAAGRHRRAGAHRRGQHADRRSTCRTCSPARGGSGWRSSSSRASSSKTADAPPGGEAQDADAGASLAWTTSGRRQAAARQGKEKRR